MIKDSKTAATVFNAAFETYVSMESVLSNVWEALPPEERETCRSAVGQIMGTILGELVEPILKQHPELMPEEWK